LGQALLASHRANDCEALGRDLINTRPEGKTFGLGYVRLKNGYKKK